MVAGYDSQSQAHFAAILSLMPDRVIRVNRNGDNLDFKGNEEDAASGVSLDWVVGRNVREFLPPEIAQQCLAAIVQTLDTGKLQTFEYRAPKLWEPNAGEWRDYEVRLVVCGENEVLAIERDITEQQTALREQQQSEQALRRSEACNRALLDAIPDIMFRIRQDGTYLDARADNEAALVLSADQVLGKTVFEVLPPDVAKQRMFYITQALQTGTPQVFEYQLLNRGKTRDYEARMVVISCEEVLVMVRDISDRKQVEAERKQVALDLKASVDRQAELTEQLQILNASLEQQVQERTAQLEQKMQELQTLNQVQDEFLYAVSHDLRTPMMGMRLVLQNLQHKPGDLVPLSRTVLDRMLQSVDRQLAMIHSLLETHSGDVRGVTLHYEPVNLGKLVGAIAADLEPLLLQNQATLTNHITPSLPLVMADPAQIQRVFENLLTNAMQHNPPNLHITLRATLEDDFIHCCVQDNGIGMTQAECDSLFDRYARGNHTRRSTSIGLGLYLCRQIITAHGGQIGAISTPGAGATFWFTLPILLN